MNIFAKLVCWWKGHRRGRVSSLIRAEGSEVVIAKMFICPRCDATWTRKAK